MQTTQSAFCGRVRAAFPSAPATILLLNGSAATTAMADQEPASQMSQAAQAPEAIGSKTHHMHGLVKTAPSSNSGAFVVTTERYGDVTVAFTGVPATNHGHGRGKNSGTDDVKATDRVAIQGRASADGKTFNARRVHVLRADNAGQKSTHVVGTVSTVTTPNDTTALTIKLIPTDLLLKSIS